MCHVIFCDCVQGYSTWTGCSENQTRVFSRNRSTASFSHTHMPVLMHVFCTSCVHACECVVRVCVCVRACVHACVHVFVWLCVLRFSKLLSLVNDLTNTPSKGAEVWRTDVSACFTPIVAACDARLSYGGIFYVWWHSHHTHACTYRQAYVLVLRSHNL